MCKPMTFSSAGGGFEESIVVATDSEVAPFEVRSSSYWFLKIYSAYAEQRTRRIKAMASNE